jgi:SAM-dependent methyltransferase
VTTYSFGDSDVAAARLRVLDNVFAPTTDALLEEVDAAAAVGPRRIADLGCGPGATTARLAARYPRAAVTGVDASAAFLAAARVAVPGATFVAADVTEALPGAPYDLVYARFLLAHLPDVAAAIASWLTALGPDGMLVLEETEHIASVDPTFARYESLSEARVRTSGADVDAGPAITAALPAPAAVAVVDRVLTLDLTAAQAASMFRPNLATWGADAVADGLISEPDRVALLDALTARIDDHTRGLFTWTHHQTVLRRI